MFDSCKDFLHFLRTKELKPKQYKGHKSALQRLIDCKLPEIREFYIVLGSDKERYELKEKVKEHIKSVYGLTVHDIGPLKVDDKVTEITAEQVGKKVGNEVSENLDGGARGLMLTGHG